MFATSNDVLLVGSGATTTVPIVGEQSFMLQDDDRHADVRKAIAPALRRHAVRRHLHTVEEITSQAVAEWPRDKPLQLHGRLRALTLDVALRTIFAHPECGQELRRLRDALLKMLDVTGSSVFPEPALRHGPGRVIWQRFLRNRAAVDELLYALIEARRDAGAEDRADLFGVLLDAHRRDSSHASERLRDDVMSLVLAGHETTAAQLSWAFQLLAHHPKIRDRLLAEIQRDEDDTYLTATVHEVLRHRPVFPFAIPRVVRETVDLAGQTYRAPTQLLGCIHLVHHDPLLYDDPHTFRPERFLSEPPQAWSWFPWGGGRRRCPGSHLATLEMKTVLRVVLAQLEPRPVGQRMERPRWRSVIVVPAAGSRVVLARRRSTTPAARAGSTRDRPLTA